MTAEGEKLHHLYGGSTAKIWRNCYGWAALTKQAEQERIDAGLPAEETNQAAIAGSAAHIGVLERRFVAGIKHLQDGTPVNVSYDDIPDFPPDGAVIAEDFFNTVFNEVLEGIVTGKQIYVEKKLMFDEEQDSGGTADIVVLYYNDKAQLVAVIGDLKTGRIQVTADSEQLLFYLTTVYKKMQEKGKDVGEFIGFIYQPTTEPAFSSNKFSKSDILRAAKAYDKAIVESKKEKPKFKVGDWCEYCKVKPRCKTFNQHVDKQLEQAVNKHNKLPPIEEVSDEILYNIFTYGDLIEDYISSVRKHIVMRFAAGRPVPGLKLVAGVSKRRWKDDQEVITKMRKLGVPATKEKALGIGAIEAGLKAKGLTKMEIKDIVDPLVVKPPAPLKVTTIEDKRPAVIMQDASALLEGLDDDIEERSDF